MPLTLTSEARVLNLKAGGVQGCSPGGGCGGEAPHQIFVFSLLFFSWTKFFQNVKIVQIDMKDAECAVNFQILSFCTQNSMIF